MKKVILSILAMLCFAQVSEATQDYSKMSVDELNKAFVAAVKKDSSDEVQKLLQAGAHVTTPIYYTWTSGDCDWEIKSSALIYAVKHNSPEVVKVLLKVVEKNELNEALDLAIKEGFSEVVQELVKGGVDINYINENKDTPLIIAVQHACSTAEFYTQAQAQSKSRWRARRKIIEILLKAGANVSHVNKYGRTALMEAVIQHDLNTVQSLLQVPEMITGSYFGFATAPINYADNDGNTALILAVKNIQSSYHDSYGYNICVNSQKIVNELLQTSGIDPHHVNKNGETAIKLLEKNR